MVYFINLFLAIFFLNFIFNINLIDDIIFNIVEREYMKLFIDIILIICIMMAI